MRTSPKLASRRRRPDVLQPVGRGERGKEPAPRGDQEDRDGAAADHGGNGADQEGGEPRLERPELMGGVDEHHLDRVDRPRSRSTPGTVTTRRSLALVGEGDEALAPCVETAVRGIVISVRSAMSPSDSPPSARRRRACCGRSGPEASRPRPCRQAPGGRRRLRRRSRYGVRYCPEDLPFRSPDQALGLASGGSSPPSAADGRSIRLGGKPAVCHLAANTSRSEQQAGSPARRYRSRRDERQHFGRKLRKTGIAEESASGTRTVAMARGGQVEREVPRLIERSEMLYPAMPGARRRASTCRNVITGSRGIVPPKRPGGAAWH